MRLVLVATYILLLAAPACRSLPWPLHSGSNDGLIVGRDFLSLFIGHQQRSSGEVTTPSDPLEVTTTPPPPTSEPEDTSTLQDTTLSALESSTAPHTTMEGSTTPQISTERSTTPHTPIDTTYSELQRTKSVTPTFRNEVSIEDTTPNPDQIFGARIFTKRPRTTPFSRSRIYLPVAEPSKDPLEKSTRPWRGRFRGHSPYKQIAEIINLQPPIQDTPTPILEPSMQPETTPTPTSTESMQEPLDEVEKNDTEPDTHFAESIHVFSHPEKLHGKVELSGKLFATPRQYSEQLNEVPPEGSTAAPEGIQVFDKDLGEDEKEAQKKFGYVVEGRDYRKYRLEERTDDGFIVGEYGVVSRSDGQLRGVRYTADGTINPKLIYEALMKFLKL